MIYGEIVQRWRLAQGAVLRKWPHVSGDCTNPHCSTSRCAPSYPDHLLQAFSAVTCRDLLLLFPVMKNILKRQLLLAIPCCRCPMSFTAHPCGYAVGEWGPWFLWALFAAILVWEEVWDLPNTAYLSGWLLIIITLGAMGCSWFFERRLWCRHLCPIGGMNGMFAKLSITELRAQPGVCSGTHHPCSTLKLSPGFHLF